MTRNVARVTVDGRDWPLNDIYKIDTRRKVIGRFARAKGKLVPAFDKDGGMSLLRYEVIVKGKIRIYFKGNKRWGMRQCN